MKIRLYPDACLADSLPDQAVDGDSLVEAEGEPCFDERSVHVLHRHALHLDGVDELAAHKPGEKSTDRQTVVQNTTQRVCTFAKH